MNNVERNTDVPQPNIRPDQGPPQGNDLEDKKAAETGSLYDVAVAPFVKKNFFKETKVGRFLSLRTKTSKAIAGILVTVATLPLPAPVAQVVEGLVNVNLTNPIVMELFEGLNLVQIIIGIVALVITVGVPLAFPKIKEKAAWGFIENKIDLVADQLKRAVDEKSDGGEKITRNEIKAIIASLFKPEQKDE